MMATAIETKKASPKSGSIPRIVVPAASITGRRREVEALMIASRSRDDVARTTEGFTAGSYREFERAIPIVVRSDPDAGLDPLDMVVAAQDGATLLPIEQVVDGFTIETQNTRFMRRDRLPTITVGASIPPDLTAAQDRHRHPRPHQCPA